jgi:predicted helicase
MVATGNPPYSISSQNSGEWITNLVADYKKNLNERNIQPLSDDYIKFIRLGQYYVHKNGEGILAYISNNGFLDGIIHRQMRKSLLEEFDKIYILNLHGNSRRQEAAPDGTPDENVFDIMQGVSINLFIKTGKKDKGILAELKYKDLYGKREEKYAYLDAHSFASEDWVTILPEAPYYFFVPKDFSNQNNYESGIKLNELFCFNKCGIKTQRDDASITISETERDVLYNDFISLDVPSLAAKYGFKDVRDWQTRSAKDDIVSNKILADKVTYRPFDSRFVLYTGKTKGVMGYPRYELMKNVIHSNVMMGVCKQSATDLPWTLVSITKEVVDMCHVSGRTKEASYYFPLYIYNDDGSRIPNINGVLWNTFNEKLERKVSPEDLFDYTYAVLHSPNYRQTYKEFLKIDFPRIPYPKDADQFKRLAEKGAELRKLHLMEGSDSWKTGVPFPVVGENNENPVEAISYSDGKVFINKTQYFGNVSELAWNFYIGGYQPAQKWLKDRKGRALDFQDILHYGCIIYALQETDRIMKEIDEIGVV